MPKRIRKTLLGRKVAMSQVYDDGGVFIPVTLIEAGPCVVLQVKTPENDRYAAVQVGFGDTTKNIKKPQEGLFKKVGTAAKKFVREIPVLSDREYSPGDILDVSLFEGVEKVDVTGDTKGRGFSGVVRRWNHHIGPKSHGSKSKRTAGSLGMHQDPGRIIKGKRMAGQYGHDRTKTRNLRVVSIDADKNLLVVRGAIPGPAGGFVCIEESL